MTRIILAILVLIMPAMATTITWDMFSTIHIETGTVPDALQALDGTRVTVSGFIVPLELDEYVNSVSEFLLVPDPLACIHVPPPPPNQIVHVTMNEPIPLDMDFRGVHITGILHIDRSTPDIQPVKMVLSGDTAEPAELEVPDPFEAIYHQIDG